MSRKIITAVSLAALMSCFQSCTQKYEMAAPEVSVDSEDVNQLQAIFSVALGKALKADPALRKFLKVESLKMFDEDYDVLYQMVKDTPIENGETFKERLSHYVSSVDELTRIEKHLPLLTILVPTLPSGFSPQNWKPNEEIPKVAVRQVGSNKVPLYNDNGLEEIIQPGDIPGFPVVVVKQNERVLVGSKPELVEGSEAVPFYQNKQFLFSFTSSAFDGVHPSSEEINRRKLVLLANNKSIQIKKESSANRLGYYFGGSDGYSISGRVIGAYHVDIANPNYEWQRDYVYYGITPSTPRGRFNDHFRETIRNFQLTNAGIVQMSGQDGDPNTATVGNMSNSTSYWTDGAYEFLVSVLCNPKDGSLAQKTIRFSAQPLQLYDMTYQKIWIYYRITAINPQPFNPNVVIAAWNLENFGTAWTYHVFEENQTVNVTKQETTTTEYAANFSFDPTFASVVKFGPKFGASATTTNQKVVTMQYTTGSTDLGEQTAYFYDPIIIGPNAGAGGEFQGNNGYYYGAYDTYALALGGTAGYVSLSVEPYSLIPLDNDTQ